LLRKAHPYKFLKKNTGRSNRETSQSGNAKGSVVVPYTLIISVKLESEESSEYVQNGKPCA
jgi:hypothetical protein